jgi:hypothetical protein
MEKGGKFKLSLLALMAGALTLGGCSKPAVNQDCVDKRGVVVDDKYCQKPGQPGVGAGVAGSYMFYRWYYGGTTHTLGSRVTGGSFIAPAGHVGVMKSGSTSRGVFGRSGSSHGGSAS